MAAEQTEAVLHLAKATRRYGNRAALDQVDLELEAGEVYALIGRNGAGKSTLAKAAIGALALDEGSVRVLGADPSSDRQVRRDVGIAPQEIALYPHLTVAENLDVFAALAGVSRTERAAAVARALDETVCTERADERLDRLSGGWRRRANLAAAIVHRPRLLVLDEPTEGLDAETRLILRGLIDGLRADRAAILLISHNIEDVAVLADRLGIMEAGRLIVEGRPAELMAEAFGGRTELVVRLSEASPAVEAILAARGLAPSDRGLCWRGIVADAFTQAGEIEMVLLWNGVELREVAVHHPGLDALIGWATGSPERFGEA
ncbi:MAG TPA: ABC transporter ATP-binding protein [Stellaceae bacterium]|jgi:ABC-2 type transport system ATP-binding protein|nr:ABC transporter ATP-binding protein [Stellaceae bacterium]